MVLICSSITQKKRASYKWPSSRYSAAALAGCSGQVLMEKMQETGPSPNI